MNGCPYCEASPKAQVLLGVLGSIAWVRCSCCGADYAMDASDLPADEEALYE